MSKKSLGLVLVVAMLVLALAVPAFAQDGETVTAAELMESVTGADIVCPEGDAEITMAVGSVGTEFESITALTDYYMETCPNVTVNYSENPSSTTDILNLYLQLWEAESADVDVFQVDVIWPAIIDPHTIDWNEYMTEEELAGFFPDMIAGQTVNGKLNAIPWFTDAGGLFYRTDLLEKYGFDVPTTWEELEEAAAVIQEGERAEGNAEFYGYVWQGNAYEGLTCDAHEWLVSTTGDSFITQDGEVNVTDPAFVELLDRAAGWVGTISPEAVTTYQEEESRNVFQSGNAAFLRNWPYVYPLANGEESAIAGNFGWTELPTGGVRSASALGGWQITVSKYSDNVDAAVSYTKYMTGFEAQRFRALFAALLPTRPAVYEDPAILEFDYVANAGPAISAAFARPSTVTGSGYAEASALFFNGIHSVLTGEMSAEDAMAELDAALTDFMAAQ